MSYTSVIFRPGQNMKFFQVYVLTQIVTSAQIPCMCSGNKTSRVFFSWLWSVSRHVTLFTVNWNDKVEQIKHAHTIRHVTGFLSKLHIMYFYGVASRILAKFKSPEYSFLSLAPFLRPFPFMHIYLVRFHLCSRLGLFTRKTRPLGHRHNSPHRVIMINSLVIQLD